MYVASPNCASLSAFSTKKVTLAVRKFGTASHVATRCRRGRTFTSRGWYLGFFTSLLNCNWTSLWSAQNFSSFSGVQDSLLGTETSYPDRVFWFFSVVPGLYLHNKSLCDRFCLFNFHFIQCRSQWPRGLRRRSSAARMLRLWVRIPPGAWMFVCCEKLCEKASQNKQVEPLGDTWSYHSLRKK